MSIETTISFVPVNNYIEINRDLIIQTLDLFQAHDFWAGGLDESPDFWDADLEDEEESIFSDAEPPSLISTIDLTDLGDIPENATNEQIADFYMENNKHLLTALAQSSILPELIRVANAYYATFGESTENNKLWCPHELSFSAGEHSFPDYAYEETAWQGNFQIGFTGYASVYNDTDGDLDLLVSMVAEDAYFVDLMDKLEKIWGSPVKVIAEYSY